MQVGEVGEAGKRRADSKPSRDVGVGQLVTNDVLLAFDGLDRAIRCTRTHSEDITRHQPALVTERR